MLNYLDWAIIIIFILFILIGIGKGLIRSVFNFISLIASVIITKNLYPYVAKFMRSSGTLFDKIKQFFVEAMDLETTVNALGKTAQNNFIESLQLPEFIKQPLMENNNIEAYDLFHVDTFENYIAGFLSNIIISGIAILTVFIISLLLLKIIGGILDLASRLPVIHQLNKTGGALVGLLQAYIIICVLVIVAIIALPCSNEFNFLVAMENSRFVGFFIRNNFLLDMLLALF